MASIRCVIPTLNSAKTLDQSLISLRSQMGVDVEIVVVDSGSTDGTLDICRRHNVETLYEEPGNIYRAINRGLTDSNTEWLSYLNSDDWLYINAYQRLIDLGYRSEADVVYGNCDYVDEEGRFLFSFAAASQCCLLPLFRMRRMGFAQPAAIFRSVVYRKLSGFNTNYRFKADADFFIRALRREYKFARLDGAPAACFRIHQDQLSNKRRAEIESEGEFLFGEMQPDLSDHLRLLKWRMANLPHYAMRIMRESILRGRLTINRSVDRHSG